MQIRNKLTAALLVVAVCSLAGGCGRGGPHCVPVRGTVSYEGKPLVNGRVMLSPIDQAQGRVATGAIDAQGHFVLSTFVKDDGLLPGSYTATVDSFLPGTEALEHDKRTGVRAKLAIPDRYTTGATSDLKVTVSAEEGSKVLEWDLK